MENLSRTYSALQLWSATSHRSFPSSMPARQTHVYFTREAGEIRCVSHAPRRCKTYAFLLPSSVRCTLTGARNYTNCALHYATYTARIVEVACGAGVPCTVSVDIDEAVANYQYFRVVRVCVVAVIGLLIAAMVFVRGARNTHHTGYQSGARSSHLPM